MPIEGRSLGEAAANFRTHLNSVLARTVIRTRFVLFTVPTPPGEPPRPQVHIAFRQAGKPVEARLATRFGVMWLYLGQLCGSLVTPEGRHRLRTVRYRYTLRPEGSEEPLLRWEYVKEPPAGARWCRHHIQGDVPLVIGEVRPSLNNLHVPTGFTTLEEVLRFCIVDLEVTPLSLDWDQILNESYELFKGAFAPRD